MANKLSKYLKIMKSKHRLLRRLSKKKNAREFGTKKKFIFNLIQYNSVFAQHFISFSLLVFRPFRWLTAHCSGSLLRLTAQLFVCETNIYIFFHHCSVGVYVLWHECPHFSSSWVNAIFLLILVVTIMKILIRHDDFHGGASTRYSVAN